MLILTRLTGVLFSCYPQIKLYTKQGSLKYQTDCAPINGYFMIPLYDKVREETMFFRTSNCVCPISETFSVVQQGDFVLKIEPPLGWSFGKNRHIPSHF